MFVARVRDKSEIEIIGKERFMSSKLDKGTDIVVFERCPMNDANTDNYTLVEVKIMQHKKSWMVFNSVQPISYSRLMIFDKRMTVREVKIAIFGQFRHLIRTPDLPSVKNSKRKHMRPEKILEEEYAWYFENPDN